MSWGSVEPREEEQPRQADDERREYEALENRRHEQALEDAWFESLLVEEFESYRASD